MAQFAQEAGLEVVDLLCEGSKCPAWAKHNVLGELVSLHVKLVARKAV